MTDTDVILEIVEGSESGRQIPLAGTVELGRDPALDTAIADEQISRRHARVTNSGGEILIEDLSSLNGTYVNEQVVQGARQLAVGDRVRVGLTVLELRTVEQVSVQRSAVEPAPDITVLGRDVLEVVPEEELAPVQPETPNVPGFLAGESEPAFIDQRTGGSLAPGARDPEDVAKLFDVRVKQQTNVAAFAVLAIVALLVLVYFAAT